MIYEHKVIKNIHFPASLLFEIKKQKCNWKHLFPVKQPHPTTTHTHTNTHTPRKKISLSNQRSVHVFGESAQPPHTGRRESNRHPSAHETAGADEAFRGIRLTSALICRLLSP